MKAKVAVLFSLISLQSTAMAAEPAEEQFEAERSERAILFQDADTSTNYIRLAAPNSLSSDYNLTLPSDDGGSGDVLISDGSGGLSWGPTFTNPMSALGDIIYGGSGGTEAVLAGNTSTTKKILTQVGNGTNSAAPAWSQIDNTGYFAAGAAATSTAAGTVSYEDSGSFTVYLRDGTSTVNDTAYYSRVGKIVNVRIPALVRTTASTTLTLSSSSGSNTWPAGLTPASAAMAGTFVATEGVNKDVGLWQLSTAGVLTLFKNVDTSIAWSSSELSKGWGLSYCHAFS